MQENRWRQIEDVFNRAVGLPSDVQREFVERECGADVELRREVLRLLENDAEENSFLNRPVLTLGARILDSDFTNLVKNGEFASYRVIRLLGRGGMGAVFLAEDTRLARLVALKILPSAVTGEEDSVRRFQQEARAASNVAHPSVAHIYEFGKFENRYFLAMEYVRGLTLRELIQEKLIDEPRALNIALQTAFALSAAHRNGVIHRDIKPENIIVGNDNAIKVLDFGLAKLNPSLESQELLTSIDSIKTVPGLLMGTVAYMSPEQLRGHAADERTDLWSLGVCLYEMLSGKRPFDGDTPSDVSAAVLRDPTPTLPFDLKFHSNFNQIIEKCLRKNRLRRYQTASDLIADLERTRKLMGDEPTNKKWTGRDWLTKAILPFALAGGLAVAAFISTSSWRETLQFNNQPPNQLVSQPATVTMEIHSIAVLPLRIVGGNSPKESANFEQLDFLSLGLAEDLTRGLGASTTFKVKAFSAAKQMSETTDLKELENRLETDAVLRGEITKNGNLLAVTVELLKLKENAVLWRKEFEVEQNDFLKLRSTLAAVIANELQTQSRNNRRIVLPEYQTTSEAAFRMYLAGKYSADRNTAAGLRRIVPILQQAVKIDPNYAVAHAALADVYNLLGSWYGEKPGYYLRLAKETLERAKRINPNLPEVHTSLAKIRMDYDRDFAGAEREFRRAIELNPSNALAHHWYGEVYLSAMGRFDESLRELETARELNPLSGGILTALAWTRIGMKDYQRAIADCDGAIAINPKDTSAYGYKSMALMKLNQFDEALDAIQKAYEISRAGRAEMGVIYAAAGETQKAREILWQLTADRSVTPYNIAVVYAALGERDKAFELLEKQARLKSVDLLSMRVDPMLDVLRDDSRFKDLEKQLNLP